MPAPKAPARPRAKAPAKPAAKSPAAKPAAKTAATIRARVRDLDGLEVSLDKAQKAVDQLRADLSTSGRALIKDVDTAVKAARRDLRKGRKAIQKDIEDLGGALTPKRTTRAAAKPRPKAKA